jgi:hypothetical protein
VSASDISEDGEGLADAGADCGDAVAVARLLETAGEGTENASARSAEWVTDGDRAAIGVHQLPVGQVFVEPRVHADQRLDGECLVEIDRVGQADAGPGPARGRPPQPGRNRGLRCGRRPPQDLKVCPQQTEDHPVAALFPATSATTTKYDCRTSHHDRGRAQTQESARLRRHPEKVGSGTDFRLSPG